MTMSRRITIRAGDVTINGELNDSATADLVWEALTIKAVANTWGDEIYFAIHMSAEEDDTAQEVVDLGAIAYWPPGSALCLFFGPTPMSQGGEIRPASAVNVLGMLEGDPTVLRAVQPGTVVEVSRA
ncbi:MAG TPA: cyclophilin-like fold protein [Dehalococcoidia bacterium]|nr:cyclophilin-like fold protein [Dehalococcoidia bacterium]MDP6272992.1 cyclophilin-like fold protein [Dehalococcoidia bacterium]MDP7159845.1 cyclophilin-like fold protein [Dehalococcoidia bacterium]MDP7213814.1 cyclophilin-like fold protein [Dehalococcoidia bacterium]MDP7514382.1 cyclophilin-like fold protein [Dehalococcoidia bacterium]|tara:strand:- start:1613 stop:1993 length:381 start_codon:yes stop_codon:yes gene_type:complete